MPSAKPACTVIRSGSSIALAFLSLAIIGCESRVAVSGKVLDKGHPVAGAELRWALEGSSTVFVSGATNSTGDYVLDFGGKKEIPKGRYQVTVTWWRTNDGRPLPDGEKGTAMKGTPKAKQYSATLTVDVTAASSALDLDLTGKGAPVEDI